MSIQDLNIVPLPAKAERFEGTFTLGANTPLLVSGTAEIPPAVKQFTAWLGKATGATVAPQLGDQGEGALRFVLAENLAAFGEEAYDINVSATSIRVLAFTPKGLVRAVQSLRQLFPVGFEKQDGSAKLPAALPCCNIVDKPRYSWRGLSMDCCRHFVPKEYLLRLIDLLTLYKFNVFHWHLTEDQGWRLQIDKFPKLTEVAAWRGENKYGGFYTKDDVREVLAYAADRGITVIPEIEMPGHSSAAIAAYPNLSCHGNPMPVSEKWGIHKDIYCAGKEDAFRFLEGVIDEVVELFPSKYIHIGGDEAPKDNWKECPHCQARIKAEGLKDENELQTWFIHRMQKYIESKGRHIIGWDEIAEGGIPANAILHHWRYDEHLHTALTTGHQVICSNVAYAYMDFPYYKFEDGTSDPPNKRAWMKATTTEKAREYEFAPGNVTADEAKLIIGGEATMWLEFTPTLDEVDAQLWPRMCGLAEAFWSPKEKGTEEGFVARMKPQEERLGNIGVKYFQKAAR